MTQQSGNQFDDDLTVGIDDSDSFSTGSIDLFEFSGDEESPIARLKTIILSIDWEINDNILQQLDDELLDLSEIWADDKIKQVYIQGLNKIGKYINKERAGAHPDAIKLLLTFYHNLERIVSSDDSMTEEDKKQLLMADVKKFDLLKVQISKPAEGIPSAPAAKVPVKPEKTKEPSEAVGQLKVLKALVLGIDWEINEHGLQSLTNEVHRLEVTFSQSKAKLILLQGIGALTSYINKMRSQSNRNTFPLLHSLYDALEKITGSELAAADEKQLLLSEVSKFNAFKAEIAQEKAAPAQVVSESSAAIDQVEPSPVAGFDETEAGDFSDINSRLDSVFGDSSAGEAPSAASEGDALAGVNVETEADDDSDEEALPFQGGRVAPALSDVAEESRFSVDKLADDLAQLSDSDEEGDEAETFATSPEVDVEAATDDLYGEELFPSDDEDVAPAFSDISDESSFSEETLTDEDETIAAETVVPLPGVDVETEADDDSDEESLPFEKGALAPALAGADEEQGFDAERMASEDDESPSDDLEDRLGAFFDDEMEASSEEWGTTKEPGSVETEEDVIAAVSDVFGEDEKPVKEEVDEFLLDEESVEESTEEAAIPAIDAAEEYAETVADELEDKALKDESEVTLVEEEAPEIAELPAEEEIVEEATEEALSFLDEEEVDTSAIDVSEEYAETVVDESEEQALTDEIGVTAVEEGVSEIAEPPVDEESIAEATEETIATPAFEEFEEDRTVVDDESEIPVSTDTIEFSVPGEEQFEAATVANEEEFESDDEIEFDVPGEELVPESAIISAEGVEREEVVFEAVGDDVEVDPLPGEEYVDQEISETSADDEEVELSEVADESVSEESELDGQLFDDYSPDLPGAPAEPEEVEEPFTESVVEVSAEGEEELGSQVEDESSDDFQEDVGGFMVLGASIETLHNNLTEDGVQNLYAEVNRLRSSMTSSHTDKIFLLLLSTVTQHLERSEGEPETESLSLLDDIYSGLEMSSATVEQVQQQILACVSQVLLLQQKNK